jgi:Bacteriocin-protection, YdeI or OmpD-Associated
MEITQVLKLNDRTQWRAWLLNNHALAKDVWVVCAEEGSLSYLDSVEEAICFGWIDGLAKRLSKDELAQRFSPRRPDGNWTELNKARAQRLIGLGLMTEAGKVKLPALNLRVEVASDILAGLHAAGEAFENFEKFPLLYRVVRIGYIEKMRNTPVEFEKRLSNFLKKTAQNKMFGNWNDGGRLS